MDGGGGFLKIIVNIFSPDEISDSGDFRYSNSGVQKSQFLAIVQDVPENYENLRLILEYLNLDDVSYSLAFDLKLANILLGISSHGGKFACMYCEGELSTEPGISRTFGSLNKLAQSFKEHGSVRRDMKHFKNVVYELSTKIF